MKSLIPVSIAFSLATASLLNFVSPAKALTWNFSYQSDPFDPAFNYGIQSGTFEAPGSDVDGVHTITELQFDHSILGAASFDAPNPPSVFSLADPFFTNEITIAGGEVTRVSILVNNTAVPSSFSLDFEPGLGFDEINIFDEIDRSGELIDVSSFAGITITPQTTTSIPVDFNPLNVFVLLASGLGITKLRKKKPA